MNALKRVKSNECFFSSFFLVKGLKDFRVSIKNLPRQLLKIF